MLHSAKSLVFRKHINVSLLTKRLCGRRNCFADRIWPVGCSLETLI